MYKPLRPSITEFIPVRNVRYHVRRWGEPDPKQTPLLLLHGWMDVGASWQFVVDAMAQARCVIAPDWRGFGGTQGGDVDNYWMPDYLADLDWLLDHYAGEGAIDLVGHSMGGNVAMQYAGVRPERVRRLVNLEGFGMAEAPPDQAPKRFGEWIDQLKRLHRGELALATYADAEGVARRLIKTNPRLPHDKAQWLASHWAAPGIPVGDKGNDNGRGNGDGSERWAILGDPAHKIVNANLFRVEETLACYRRISAPVLMIEADEGSMEKWWKGRYTLAEFHKRLKQVPDARVETVADAGHMLHHDQPERVALLIEDFIR